MTPLVLLHGGGLGPWSWRRHVALLEDGFSCHAPALPGHRGSSSELFDMDVAVEEVVELAARLGEPVVLAGLSLGGQLATQVAARHPDAVRCLIGSGVNTVGIPFLGLVVASLPMVKAFARVGGLGRATGRAMGVPAEELEEFVADGRTLGREQLAAIYRCSSDNRVPGGLPVDKVLVVAGEKEPSPIRRSLVELGETGVRTAVVPGGKHTWPLNDPALFAECVQSWYAGTVPAALRSGLTPSTRAH